MTLTLMPSTKYGQELAMLSGMTGSTMKDTNMVIDDSELYIPEFSPVCSFCRHALPEKRKCKAFDGDIPLPIWNGDNSHTEPVEGDNGIQFEQVQP